MQFLPSFLTKKFLLRSTILVFGFFLFAAPNYADAAIELVGTSTAQGTNAAYNVALNSLQGGIAGAAAQDDLVVVVNAFANTTDSNSGVGTAGYTELFDVFNGNDTNDTNFSVSYKFMTASPDTVVSCNPSSGTGISSVCFVSVYRGVDTSSPLDLATTSAHFASTATNAGDDPDCPSIQPVTLGSYILCLGAAGGTTIDAPDGWTAPAGYTNLARSTPAVDPGTVAGAVGAHQAWDGIGAEDPAAFVLDLGTPNANSAVAASVVLRPIAVAPTVTTDAETNVLATSSTIGGDITVTGGSNATARGFATSTNSATLSNGDTSTSTTAGDFGTGAWTQAFSNTNLVGNTTYYYRAYATNPGGTGYGAIGDLLTVPDRPAAPSITNVVATSTTINWSAPTGGVGTYEVQYCIDGANNCVLSTGLAVTSTTTNPSLTGNTTYSFAVRGTNATGDGLFSASTTQLTLPSPPTSLILSNVTATTTDVSWTAPTGGASSYTLTVCNGTCTVYSNISGVSTTTYNLASNASYTYSVLATNATGDGLRTATSTQLTVPNIPGTPTFSNVTATAMRVSWTAPTGGATTYKLERCSGSACTNYASVATGIAALFYDDSGLAGNTTYRYRVRATNATGDGAYSAGAEQATAAAAPTVTTSAATNVVATSSTIGGNITDVAGSNATARGFATSTASDLSSSVSTSTESGSFSTGAWTASFSNTNITGNTTYYYRAYATNPGGTGYGSITSVLTLPDRPNAPSISDVVATSTTITWSAPTGGASTYKLQYCVNGSSPCTLSSGLAVTSTSTNTLAGNTTYSFAVRGTNATGDGLYSASTTQLTVPNVPTSILFTNTSATTTDISWTAPTGGASTYKLIWCTIGSCSTSTGISGISTTTYSLSPNTAYTFKVLGTNASGDGYYTASSSLTTLPDAPGSPSIGSVAATSTSVTWTAPTNGAGTYKLQYCVNGSSPCTLSTGLAGLSTTTNPLVGNTTYSFAVRGTNTEGDGLFSASSTQLTLSNIPGTPTFSGITSSAITLSWDRPVGSSTSYKVERCTGTSCSDYAQIATGLATSTYGDSGLTFATTYRYRVQGTNATGDGLYSAGAEQITSSVAPTVSTEAASTIVATSSILNANITATGGSNATARGFATSTSSTLDSSVSTSTESGSFSTGAFTGSNTGLTGNTTYYFRAYATNAVGTGYGSIVSFLTLPNIPGTPTLSGITTSAITLSWDRPVGSSTSYKVERCTGSGCSNYAQIAAGVATSTYSDSGLSGGTTYRYRVRGVNATGNGLYSAGAESSTLVATPTVTTNSASLVDTNSATLNGEITATGGANSTERGFAWGTSATMVGTTATTSESGSYGTGTFTHDLNSLDDGTTYYFRAYALNSAGTSTGAIVSFVTSEYTRSGAGSSIGGDAPAGQGIVGGGSAEGGEDIGGEPNFLAPTASGAASNFAINWTSPGNAYTQDASYATAASTAGSDFSSFGFTVPGANTILGIAVKLLSSASSAAGSIRAELSWNGGTATTTANENTGTLTTTDTVYTLGGASDLWGRSWSASEFSDGNFRLRLVGIPSSNTVSLDAIQVRVYHQAGGGGGGGGGGEL